MVKGKIAERGKGQISKILSKQVLTNPPKYLTIKLHKSLKAESDVFRPVTLFQSVNRGGEGADGEECGWRDVFVKRKREKRLVCIG